MSYPRILFTIWSHFPRLSVHTSPVFLSLVVFCHRIGVADEPVYVHHDWQATLIAHEPQVVDPIAIRFDSKGRMWVVEMRDYPTGPKAGSKPQGRIRILRDLDRDGVYEHAITFADGLLFPTGIQPWRSGAYVTLAGQIVYFNDSDGDDVADEETICFTGFATGNEQLRANHPRLGPDGLIYVANGLMAGKIKAIDSRFEPRNAKLDLHGSDFCFNPDGGKWDVVAGNSQYGMSIDDYGRRIGCSNRNPAFTTLANRTAVSRDTTLTSSQLIYDVTAVGESSQVRPRSAAWTTSNLHAGQFSAACGVFADGAFDKQNGHEMLLVCEPTGNLVQRQWLESRNGTWTSLREDREEEFFASTDTWLRPVDIVAGPHDSIYVVDMVRAVIEHPDWVPEEQKKRSDTWDGNDRGRIFRLSRKGESANNTDVPPTSITSMLNDPNPWIRELATQLLYESAKENKLKEIQGLLVDDSKTDFARARALHWMAAKELLDAVHLQKMLSSNQPRLLELAISLTPSSELLGPHVDRLAGHEDVRVPIVLVERLSNLYYISDDKDANENLACKAIVDVTLRIADRARDNVQASLILGSIPSACLPDLCEKSVSSEEVSKDLLAHWFLRWAESAPNPSLHMAAEIRSELAARKAKVLAAWAQGQKHSKKEELASNFVNQSLSVDGLSSTQEFCRSLALDDAASAGARVDAITFLHAIAVPSADSQKLLEATQPTEVRLVAIPWLFDHNWVDICNWFERELHSLPPILRTSTIDLLVGKPNSALWLLDRIERGTVTSALLSPQVTKRLMESNDEAIANRSRKMFAISGDRQALLDRYQSASLQGPNWDRADLSAGKIRFEQSCSACHRIDEVGVNVGPDISDTRDKTTASILHSILHPNAAIDAAYYQYSVMTVDGQVIDGLLVDDQPHGVTLRRQGGLVVLVTRENIDDLRASTISLMPDGFERVIDEQEMANLIAYLKNWRYLKASSTIQAK